MRALALAVVAAACVAAPAAAETYWTYEEDGDPELIPRLRFAPHVGLWIGEFDRTERGCEQLFQPGVTEPGPPFERFALRERQVPFESFCATQGSDEVGIGGGISAMFRALGPVHIDVGLEAVVTVPDRFGLLAQFIVAVPIGLSVTFDQWKVRPIARAVLTPYLGLPDLRRGFTYGGELGMAWRIDGLAELQLTGGYHASSDWQMGIVRVGGFLPH